MDWVQTSHCSWDFGEMRIVKQFCPKNGGVIFKLFDGKMVKIYDSFDAAKASVYREKAD